MTIEELLSDETFAGLIDTVDPVERASKLVQLQLEAKKLDLLQFRISVVKM